MHILVAAASGAARAGLRGLLSADAGLCVVGEAGSGLVNWPALLSQLRPDVVVADDGPLLDRVTLLSALAGTACGLVLVSDDMEGASTLSALHLSGWAFLPGDADAAQLSAAVRAVAAGLVVLDREHGFAALPAAAPVSEDNAGEPLTARERDVLQLLARGLPNKQIAARLGISAHTAKFHVASVMAKLGASSRTEAVANGARRGDVLL